MSGAHEDQLDERDERGPRADRSLLVVGVGNRDRGDDAVGPVVCDLIDAAVLPDVETLVVEGSVLDLPIRWRSDDRVVIVDAAAPAGCPGRVSQVDALAQRLLPPTAVSTHSIDVAAAVELARALGRLPAELTILGIEGASFDFGGDLTPEVRRAADDVIARIAHGRDPAPGQY